MTDGKEEAALDEQQVEEARTWIRRMIDNECIPIITIAKMAGVEGAAVISKFHCNHHMSTALTQQTAKKLLGLKEIFDRVSAFEAAQDWRLQKVFIDGIRMDGGYRSFPNQMQYIGLHVKVRGDLVADIRGNIIGTLGPVV